MSIKREGIDTTCEGCSYRLLDSNYVSVLFHVDKTSSSSMKICTDCKARECEFNCGDIVSCFAVCAKCSNRIEICEKCWDDSQVQDLRCYECCHNQCTKCEKVVDCLHTSDDVCYTCAHRCTTCERMVDELYTDDDICVRCLESKYKIYKVAYDRTVASVNAAGVDAQL